MNIMTPRPVTAKPHILHAIQVTERPGELTLLVQCPHCYRLYLITTTLNDFTMWANGSTAARAFSELTEDERELLITGTCAKCWDELVNLLDPIEPKD